MQLWTMGFTSKHQAQAHEEFLFWQFKRLN
jgi:hypothetical protein